MRPAQLLIVLMGAVIATFLNSTKFSVINIECLIVNSFFFVCTIKNEVNLIHKCGLQNVHLLLLFVYKFYIYSNMVLKQSTRRKQNIVYIYIVYICIFLLTKNVAKKANQYSHKRRSMLVNKSHRHILYKVMHFKLFRELPIAGYTYLCSRSLSVRLPNLQKSPPSIHQEEKLYLSFLHPFCIFIYKNRYFKFKEN